MIKLSDHDIDEILHSIDVFYFLHKSVKKRDEMINLIKLDIKNTLKTKSSGIKENVCSNCLGTGYNDK